MKRIVIALAGIVVAFVAGWLARDYHLFSNGDWR